MPDPITTVVTVISEHPQAAAAVASIYGVAKPFLAKILGPGAEEIGEIGRDYIKGRRAKNAERTLSDADKLLTEIGREPQEVPLDVAVPLLEAASLQENPTLAELWAALLANAADPAQRVAVQPGFAEVLRQLTPTDAQVMALLYEQASYDPKHVRHALKAISTAGFAEALGLSLKDFAVAMDSLFRLRLCEMPASIIYMYNEGELPPASFWQIVPTLFGFEFLQAVTPPTP